MIKMDKLISNILKTKLPKLPKLNKKFFTDGEVKENIKTWVRDYIGETNLNDVRTIKLSQIIQILEMLEEKMSGNSDKIIFYIEEGKNSNTFSLETKELKIGFIAKSFFTGILGSVIVECFFNKERLKYYIDTYEGVYFDTKNKNIEDFLYFICTLYEDYSLIFNLNDTFHNRVQYGDRVPYTIKEFSAKLVDVDTWNIERLKMLL